MTPLSWFRAPGRVNLMGDHTDYNQGLVLPVAIDRYCVISAQPNREGRVRIRSSDFEGPADIAADGSEDPDSTEPRWARLCAGVIRSLFARERPPVGIDARVKSSIPIGSGLSSSAAFEVATALALLHAAALDLPRQQIALACQEAEHAATGVPSGIMDQVASLFGRAGSAILLDCRSLALRPITVPNLSILVVHSGLPRILARTEYAERRRDCERLASSLGIRSLRDASLDQVRHSPIGRHVVSENRRVIETAEALADGDAASLGRLLAESHASLRDDYRVSTPELDLLVDLLVGAGAVGARLTGAGFGGCVVALVDPAKLPDVRESVVARYRAQTGIEATSFVCGAVDGARRFDPDAS